MWEKYWKFPKLQHRYVLPYHLREKDEILYLAPADGVTKNRMIDSWVQNQNFDNGQSICQYFSNFILGMFGNFVNVPTCSS